MPTCEDIGMGESGHNCRSVAVTLPRAANTPDLPETASELPFPLRGNASGVRALLPHPRTLTPMMLDSGTPGHELPRGTT